MNNAKKLLARYGSPLYVYDKNCLEDRCKRMKQFEEALKTGLCKDARVSMHYAIKANSNPAILKIVKQHGLKVDCMSPLELRMNEISGFKADEMLYVCNNVSVTEMKHAHEKGLLVCLDSISQVETYGRECPSTDIMVRINPGVIGIGHSQKVVTSGKATKFGISKNNLKDLFNVAEKYNLRIIGTHQHLGSLFLNDKISDYIAGVKAGLDIVKQYFKDVEIVDLGGGFGVPYELGEKELDFSLLEKELIPVLNTFMDEYPSVKEFKFEPGRYIPCEAGYLLGTVMAIKYENGIWWIGTDIGMGMIARPAMYDSYHEITLPDTEEAPIITANFCGNVCESGDILGKQRTVLLPKVGDTVVVYNAGAYGYSMTSNYTGRLRPAEVMIYGKGKCKLIRRAEEMEDVFRMLQ